MLAVLVFLIDGQGICHGRRYLSKKAHCTAKNCDLQPFKYMMDCGPNFWEIPIRHWEIPLNEGTLGANPNFQKMSRLLGGNPAKRSPAYRKFTVCEVCMILKAINIKHQSLCLSAARAKCTPRFAFLVTAIA
jgi:hypothetical protein